MGKSKTRSKRGRPTFRPTNVMRRKVETYLAGGMSREQIALALGISPPTLDKHFASELRQGFARKKAEAIELLWKQAKAGSTSAARKIIDTITIVEAAAGSGNAADDEGKSKDGRQKLPTSAGKKALANLAAQTAGEGTEWGDDLAPPDTKTLN